MHFDDRLATVLFLPAQGGTLARIQYRQLLDLLGTIPSDAHGRRIDAAYLRLAELSRDIPAAERASLLHDPALRLRSPRLVLQLADGEPAVAAAALANARLREEQWLDLIPALPVRARGFVRLHRGLSYNVEQLLARLGIGDRGLPSSAEIPSKKPPAHAPKRPAVREAGERIGAIVERIEEFRKARQVSEAESRSIDSPLLPLSDDPADSKPTSPRSFDFTTDTAGRIVWSDTTVAPMTVGLRLTSRDPENPVLASSRFNSAFRRRQPIRNERLLVSGAPAIAGEWVADAAPRFDQPGGGFIGYIGRLRRFNQVPLPASPAERTANEADRMRQILHELRTPTNAIQGFAEAIQNGILGPAPNEYRALAASIVGDNARILAGLEELERLVKLESGALEMDSGTSDLAEIVSQTITQLEAFTSPRQSGFLLSLESNAMPVAMAQDEAVRMVWRLLATLAGSASPGEVLKLWLRQREGNIRLIARLPATLAAQDDDALFHASIPLQPQSLSAGSFGSGFALRLASSEARSAGGSLHRKGDKLRLLLPGLTQSSADHSQEDETRASTGADS